MRLPLNVLRPHPRSSYAPAATRSPSVSVIGPVRMDYPQAIRSVRDVAFQLSRYVEELYENV